MGGSFGSFEIARSGLFVNERGLYVTGHNISNVNTPGYVRQQAMITTGPYQSNPAKNGTFQFGLGADIEQIRQIRHTFLDNIYRQENTTLGYWETRSKTFQDIQAILGEPMGVGLQGVMNQFWDSWQELSKEPDSLTVRALVRQRGQALVQHINHLGTQLDKLQSDLNSEIRVRIDEVNQITAQIAKLNTAIANVEFSGDTANDYRDQRNTLVDRLTKLANVEVMEMQDGQLDITLGGYFLVSKALHNNLVAEESKAGSLYYVPKLEGTNIEVPLKSGILKGLLESRGEVSGAKGSYENGTPNTKADVTIVIDTNSGSPVNAAYVTQYIDELKKRGLDVNVSTVSVAATDFNDVATAVNGITGLRADANKYVIVFTDKDTTAADPGVGSLINSLKAKGMELSAVTTSAAGGWGTISENTEGKYYDIASSDYSLLMNAIAGDTTSDVNRGISEIHQSNNIISDIKMRLNALINIMAREVNYLHSSGKTLVNGQGQDFFTAINDSYPLEMGNIKLNDNLRDLNNLVASASGTSGDNTLALAIGNLRNSPVLRDVTGVLSIDDYYQSIILNVGSNGNDAIRITQNQQQLVHSADAFRLSIMGVSMDEEMTNMMKYKFAYDASSRVINILDDMIETVITRMGLSGR